MKDQSVDYEGKKNWLIGSELIENLKKSNDL